MEVAIYGIQNCGTMRKARAWLEARGIAHSFHDYRIAGVARERLEVWCGALGWETLLNRSGTTFRGLPEADRQDIDRRKAVRLMLERPTMIKRPVLDLGGRLVVGFRPEIYEEAFRAAGRGRRRAV